MDSFNAALASPATQLATSQEPGTRSQEPVRNRPQLLLPCAQKLLARPSRKPCRRGGLWGQAPQGFALRAGGLADASARRMGLTENKDL